MPGAQATGGGVFFGKCLEELDRATGVDIPVGMDFWWQGVGLVVHVLW